MSLGKAAVWIENDDIIDFHYNSKLKCQLAFGNFLILTGSCLSFLNTSNIKISKILLFNPSNWSGNMVTQLKYFIAVLQRGKSSLFCLVDIWDNGNYLLLDVGCCLESGREKNGINKNSYTFLISNRIFFLQKMWFEQLKQKKQGSPDMN